MRHAHLSSVSSAARTLSRWFVGFAAIAAIASLASPRPLAAQEPARRVLSSLSAADSAVYLRGEGRGMALAAELNGFPGPRHVLQVADSLALTPAQRRAIARIEAGMRADVLPLGRELAAAELRLDSLFARGAGAPGTIDSLVLRSAATAARLRAAHLRAHIAARALLSPAQLARYRALGPGATHDHVHEGAHAHGHPNP